MNDQHPGDTSPVRMASKGDAALVRMIFNLVAAARRAGVTSNDIVASLPVCVVQYEHYAREVARECDGIERPSLLPSTLRNLADRAESGALDAEMRSEGTA